MDEFQEVVENVKRMCSTCGEFRGDCPKCPINGMFTVEERCVFYDYGVEKFLNTVKEYAEKWASEHPEPQYPTWEEWQEADYPNARFPISLCHFIKGSICPRPMNPLLGSCVECRKKPIPADIAEKLHIPPKGAKE